MKSKNFIFFGPENPNGFLKQTITLLLLILLILSLGGCAITGKVVQQTQAEEQPIRIGWIGPLTGEAAIFGIANKRGVEIAVQEINTYRGIHSRPIKLILEDDVGQNNLAVNAYQKLTKISKVDAILMPLYNTFITVAEFADRDKTIIVDSVDTSEEIARVGEYAFGVGIYDEGIGVTIAEFVVNELDEKEVGIAYNHEDAFMVLVREGFVKEFKQLGGRVLIDEEYDFSTTDFRSVILKAKNAGVDTLIVLGYDEAGFLLKQAKELGIDFTFIGSDVFSSQGFMDNAAGAEEGAYFTFWSPPDSPDYKRFLTIFKNKYGEEPHEVLFSAIGYDAMHFLARAMERSDLSTESMKNELYKVKNHKGLTGSLTMSPDGIVRSVKESIFKIEQGNFVEVLE